MSRFLLAELARKVSGSKSFDAFYADHPCDWLEWDTSMWKPAKSRSERTLTSSGAEASAAQPLMYLALTIPKGGTECTLGRSARCDLSLNESTLSSKHLGFKRTPEWWTVEDLGSSNGSTLDGRPLFPPGEARPLEDGHVLTAGDLHLTFRTAKSLYAMLRALHEKPLT
jgi:hypothetical protein